MHELHRDALARRPDAERRALLHRRLGTHLERGAEAAPQAARIALHLIEGGDGIGAVRHLRRGAERAVARRAYSVGGRLLRRALEIVLTHARRAGAVAGRARAAHRPRPGGRGPRGLDRAEAERALVQARGVAERLGDNEPWLTVLLSLATLYEVRGDVERAARRRTSCWPRARRGAGPDRRVPELVACNLFHRGAFVRALEHADRGVAWFETEGDSVHATFPSTLGDHAAVGCLDWAGLALWFLGFPDQALERAHRALELAELPVRRYSYAAACAQLAQVHVCRGEVDEVLHWAQETVDAATEAGYAYRVAVGCVLRGWARVHLGEADAGIGDLVSGLAGCRAIGVGLDDTLHLGLLADAYLHLEDPEAALEALGEALGLAAREHASFYEPELLRLRGVALDRMGAPRAEVQAALDAALDIARRHGARSLALRAAVTQAAVWDRAGRGAAGRAVVAEELAGFTEGLDAPDLRAAAALLGRAPAA